MDLLFFRENRNQKRLVFYHQENGGVRLKFSHQYFMVTNQPGLGSSLHFMVPSGNLLHSYWKSTIYNSLIYLFKMVDFPARKLLVQRVNLDDPSH